jgi:ferrous iron transport protein A
MNTQTIKPLFTLDQLCRNDVAKVVKIDGGWNIRQRLVQLGLHIGDIIRTKRGCKFGGPVLITIQNYDIAIGQGMARRIWVTKIES